MRKEIRLVKARVGEELFYKANMFCEKVYQEKKILKSGCGFKDFPDYFLVSFLNEEMVGTLGVKVKKSPKEKLPLEEISNIRAGCPASELMRFSLSCDLRSYRQVALILFEGVLDFVVSKGLIDHEIYLVTHNGVANLFERATGISLFIPQEGKVFLERIPSQYRDFYFYKKTKISRVNSEGLKEFLRRQHEKVVVTP